MIISYMVRAIFFDFYSVWTPDRFQEYLSYSQSLGPKESAALTDLVEKYYLGEVNLDYLADALRYKLGRAEIDEAVLTLNESDISPSVVSLMRGLHGHFLKLGVLANLGKMELDFLRKFNTSQSVFEVILSPLSVNLKAPLLSEQVFTKALQAIGEPPASCVVVSGHPDYLAYASKHGMQTINFVGLDELVKSLGNLLAKDMPSFVIPMP
jgi:FMN phosphatase YigB (HAD superfamily)